MDFFSISFQIFRLSHGTKTASPTGLQDSQQGKRHVHIPSTDPGTQETDKERMSQQAVSFLSLQVCKQRSKNYLEKGTQTSVGVFQILLRIQIRTNHCLALRYLSKFPPTPGSNLLPVAKSLPCTKHQPARGKGSPRR